MKWDFQPAVDAFPAAASSWDALNRAAHNHILLDSGFVLATLRHFADQKVLLATSDNGPSAMALLVYKGKGRWETFQPAQAPIGLFVSPGKHGDGAILQSLTRSLPGLALQLTILQQDPDYPCVPLQNPNSLLERVDYIQTARIPVSGSFEDYWKNRGNNLRHNLARRRRRLVEQGTRLELITVQAPELVVTAIREYGELESRGWKGQDGTAVSEDNPQGHFYRDIFEYFCARGEGRIFQWLLDGKVAASDLCLVRNGMMVVLKTAYDEGQNHHAPALMMREEIMRSVFHQGTVQNVEFYGRVMEWHTKWSNDHRSLYHLNCLRGDWVAPLKKLANRFA